MKQMVTSVVIPWLPFIKSMLTYKSKCVLSKNEKMKIVLRSHSWIITNIWCCENSASCYVWSSSTFLWLHIPLEWFLGSFCWNLSELEYIWNVNIVKWIIWFCPWKVNIFFNYLSYITWVILLTLTQVSVSRKKKL